MFSFRMWRGSGEKSDSRGSRVRRAIHGMLAYEVRRGRRGRAALRRTKVVLREVGTAVVDAGLFRYHVHYVVGTVTRRFPSSLSTRLALLSW